MAGPGDLHDLCLELLDAGAEALDTLPDLLDTTYAGAPLRQFVSPGLPVLDCCELLATWADPISEGARTRQTLAADMHISRPTVNLIVTRCVPTGRVEGKEYVPPDPDDLTAAAAQVNADGWAVWTHLFNLLQEDLLFAKCHDLLWNTAPAMTPSGGCAGWRFSFTVGLDGYEETLAT
jgi:hypothetical protein